MTRRGILLAAFALTAVFPSMAKGAAPVLPLAEVRAGMSCTGLSVIRGTAISSFDVEVLDVIAAEAGLSGPRILVRVSGPAVDASGIGPGFSGSPVICAGRNAGAISEGIGEYGNHVVLVTPIEDMLADRPATPAFARRDRGLLRAARPLATPLTVSGLGGRSLRLLGAAARRAGRPLVASPAGPAGGFAAAPLNPGSAVAASISTGDLSIGSVGTVTYRDGDRLWAFGHPLDGLGRRSLFLTDAYVFGVIQNPLALAELGAMTYKLASSDGHVQGAVTSDKLASIAGTLGPGPGAVPLRVQARDRSGRAVILQSLLADERALGLGSGLGLVAPLGASQALERLLRDYGPATLQMCARFRVRELRRPLSFCNPYFSVEPALDDLARGAELVDGYEFGPLRIERAEVSVRARNGVTRDILVKAEGPRRVRAGQRIRVRLTVQRRRGARRALSVPVSIPGGLRPGLRTLTLAGNGGQQSLEDELVLILFESLEGDGLGGGAGGPGEPRNLRELAAAVRALHRPLGIEARFKRRPPRLVRRSDEISFEGRARLSLRVVPGRPRR